MARSSTVSSCIMQIHGLSRVDIDSKSADPGFVSVHMLVKEANAEYTMLSASEHWDPHGKTDNGVAPEVLYTKAEVNTVVQKQVSAALKQCPMVTTRSLLILKNQIDMVKVTNKMTSQRDPKSCAYPSKPGKPNHKSWQNRNQRGGW